MYDAVELILENAAIYKYYIDDKDRPAIIIESQYSPKGNFTLWFGGNIIVEGFKTLKEARQRAFEIFSKSTHEITITEKNPRGSGKLKIYSFEQVKMEADNIKSQEIQRKLQRITKIKRQQKKLEEEMKQLKESEEEEQPSLPSDSLKVGE